MLTRSLISGQRKYFIRVFSTSNKQYDLTVIGGGPGGYVAAIKAAQLGLKTAIVEKRGSLGGTCLNVGCIPSKALLNSSHKYEDMKENFDTYGVYADNVRFDLGKMMKQKDAAVRSLTRGIEFLMNKNKVDYYKGWGKFADSTTISIDLNNGKTKSIRSKNTIIATGSEPSPFPGGKLSIDENRVISSTGALSLKEVPKKMILVGGGVIGLEMGSVYSRLGTEVVVVEFMDRIMPNFDKEISSTFTNILKRRGFKFMFNTKVVGGSLKKNGAALQIETVDGDKLDDLEADYVLVATGRRPYTEGLGLENIGVTPDVFGRIEVDDKFTTNAPNIYAIGDVIRGPMLAHKAEEEGVCVVENLKGLNGHVNYDAIPGVVYTHPEIATVGKTEEELQEAKVKYSVGKFPFSANSRARTNNEADGFVKVLTEKDTDKLLGVHMIGSNAGELIAEAVIGIEYGATSEDISRSCHAHPTLSEAMKEAMMAAHFKAVHV
ncbi:unnamed protein product [Moneuplotes crassus]|uniref:Dihydrolipoyl dehydrogenase n=1 Tax=Euplotes crassus TaxID=5936 RepID=A0AAD1UD66_EUPCR|nr:unnamed protein product [Moneuplotes crassus]